MASDNETELRLLASQAQKKKFSDSEAGRITKYRSSQACRSCRLRKVRCDVLANGSPCTNCKLDDTDCVVLASRRGKTPRRKRESTIHNVQSPRNRDLPPPGSAEVHQQSPTGRSDSGMDHDVESTSTVPDGANKVPVCVTFDEDSQSNSRQRMGDDGMRVFVSHSPSAAQGPRGYSSLQGWPMNQGGSSSRPSNGPNYYERHQETREAILLPDFIVPIPMEIPIEDINFLRMKGAFDVPEPELRIELLRSYMFSVHPFMPILDRAATLDCILNDDNDSRISILLFQAVMFAGLASLELPCVQALGFKSTKDAREVFFQRVRLLFEFGIEQNEESVLQSLLLLSSWYDRHNQRRDTWHWTGLALSVAQTMGLHREPTSRCGSERKQQLRRRLWWSLYIRDRLLALGTRRPMRIRDDSFNVAMLTLEDFEVCLESETDLGRSIAPDVEETTITALMCIELAKLCIIIGHVLTSQYTTLRIQPSIPHTMAVVPRHEEDRTPGELDACDNEINEWFQALRPIISRSRPPTAMGGSHSCSAVHMGILNMIHLTLINVLHRTQALGTATNKTESQAMQKPSRSKVKDAACQVTRITYAMLCRDQVRFLGVAGVTALLAACLSHMLDIRLGDEDLRDASLFRFYQSMQVMQSLRGIYTSADSSVSFLASVVQKAGIPLPAQVVAPALDFISGSADGFGSLKAPTMESATWTTSPQGGRATIAEGRSRPTRWKQKNTSQRPLLSARSYSQSSVLFDDQSILPPRRDSTAPSIQADTYHSNSTTAFSTSGYAPSPGHDDIPSYGQDMSQSLATPFSAVYGANIPFYDLNNGGIDMNAMAGDDEFYSNAFGILHNQFQDLQPIAYRREFYENGFGSLIP